MFSSLFKKDQDGEAALELYNDIVAQSRTPTFYADLGIPDTPEGRFDLITLHTFMVLRRLKQESASTSRFAQKLFDVMFKNMDHSLREMGVGDLSVGKKVRGLAEVFYGRVRAYDTALDAQDRDALKDALARNMYDDESIAESHGQAVTDYVLTAIDRLEGQPVARIMSGIVSFPAVEKEQILLGTGEAHG